VNPASAALGGTATISVTVATSMASLRWPERPGERQAVWLAGLLPLGLLVLRRRGLRRLGEVALLGCLWMTAGCGASRLIPLASGAPGSSGTPTPSGTYNLVVSGMSAGLTRSVGLVLVVQ
jgi:hypothetical protein